MFKRDDLPGVLLLALCGVVAIGLLIEIFTDYEFTFSGPGWLGGVISIVGMGLVVLMSVRAWKGRFQRGRGNTPSWPGNDVPGHTFGRPNRSNQPSSTDIQPIDSNHADRPENPPR